MEESVPVRPSTRVTLTSLTGILPESMFADCASRSVQRLSIGTLREKKERLFGCSVVVFVCRSQTPLEVCGRE